MMEDAVMSIKSAIGESKASGEDIAVVGLDFRKAFDTVEHHHIIGSEENVWAAQRSLEYSVAELGRHRLCLVSKIKCWNTVALPRVNHILRCTPKIKEAASKWKKMGEDFVNIPNNVGKKRLYAPRSEGGLGMIDVEIHWSVLLISWLKRYPLVDHLWKNALSGAKSLSIPTLGPGNDKGPPNPPLHRPWNELWDFPQELLEAYWKEVGVGGPL
ncbi:Putative LOC101743068, partial [Caligus rogercresseyi]